MAKKLNLDTLREAVEHIEARPHSGAAVVASELQETFKAKITESPKGSGTYRCSIGGLTARGAGKLTALENWANAARRQLRVAA